MEKKMEKAEFSENDVHEDELPLPLVDVMNSSQFTFSPDQCFVYYDPLNKRCLVTHYPLSYSKDVLNVWRPVDLIYPKKVDFAEDSDSLIDFSDMASAIDMKIRKMYINFITSSLKNERRK